MNVPCTPSTPRMMFRPSFKRTLNSTRLRADGSAVFPRFVRRDLLFQVVCDFGELGEGGLEIFDDFLSDNVRIGKVGAVFEAFVFEPENIATKSLWLTVPLFLQRSASLRLTP